MDGMSTFDRLESEVRSYVRSFPVVFATARGAILTDEAGNEYLDFLAGAGTLNYGHNNDRIRDGIIDYLQEGGIVHGLDMATVAKRNFLEAFDEVILAPRSLPYKLQFTGPTGANAIEAALKLARLVTGRSTVLAFTHGFHGVSVGALAATASSKYRSVAGVALQGVTFLPYDGYFGDSAEEGIARIERLLDDPSSGIDAPAAILVETVQGEGGINVARVAWLRGLAAAAKARGILLIVDDIQSGCGRTGEFFSFEESGIVPDLVTLSKSLSGYGLPMAVVLVRSDLDVWKPGQHNGTFRGNNLGFVGATAALNLYWRDSALSDDVARKGAIVRERLTEIAAEFPQAGFDVRGRGLINGLGNAGNPQLAEDISREAFRHGLVIETSGARGEVLKFLPPLTIDDEQLERGLTIVQQSVRTLVR